MSRRIINARCYASGFGTHKYLVEYEGEWSDFELITAVDNGKWNNPKDKDLIPRHYGGRCSNEGRSEDGNKIKWVHVYYD